MTLNLGWFSSGQGQGSLELLSFIQKHIRSGKLDAKIQFVFSNREPGEHHGSDTFFETVDSHGIPIVTYSSRKFLRPRTESCLNRREEYDKTVVNQLESFSVDICVLAGYMLIVSPMLFNSFTMINLHPALPSGPKGTWQEVIWTLIGQNADETGAMVHLVTQDIDRGPPLTYFTLPIRGPLFDPHWQALGCRSVEELKGSDGNQLPLFQRIRHEGRKRESYLLLETLMAIDAGTIAIRNGIAYDANGNTLEGLHFTNISGETF